MCTTGLDGRGAFSDDREGSKARQGSRRKPRGLAKQRQRQQEERHEYARDITYLRRIEMEAMETHLVRCLDCGNEHTEIYPDGLEGDESYSDPTDPKTCEHDSQYEIID